MMYTYEYERVFCSGVLGHKALGYQDIIARRGRDGWRYVGFIPAVQKGYGFMSEIDLVFEKEL